MNFATSAEQTTNYANEKENYNAKKVKDAELTTVETHGKTANGEHSSVSVQSKAQLSSVEKKETADGSLMSSSSSSSSQKSSQSSQSSSSSNSLSSSKTGSSASSFSSSSFSSSAASSSSAFSSSSSSKSSLSSGMLSGMSDMNSLLGGNQMPDMNSLLGGSQMPELLKVNKDEPKRQENHNYYA